MKLIRYKVFQSRINHGTEDEPVWEDIVIPKKVKSPDRCFEKDYANAQAEAYNGEVTVEEVADPETPAPSGGDSIWDEMDAAYQEGVDSV